MISFKNDCIVQNPQSWNDRISCRPRIEFIDKCQKTVVCNIRWRGRERVCVCVSGKMGASGAQYDVIQINLIWIDVRSDVSTVVRHAAPILDENVSCRQPRVLWLGATRYGYSFQMITSLMHWAVCPVGSHLGG